MSGLKCPNCQAKVHSGLNSLGERIVYESRGLMLVPELRVDGETILMTRPVFELHECKAYEQIMVELQREAA